jgi:methionyl-tRNA synthetase
MSKSFGNVIDPNELLEKYGRDTVRYYFAKELIATENNNFNEEKMQEVYNSDLANIYGNLISRFLGIIKKTGNVIKKNNDNKNEFDQKIIDDMNYFLENIENKINLFEVDKVLNMILDLGKSANKYIENTKP